MNRDTPYPIFFNIDPYYRLEIYENDIKVLSTSPYRKGIDKYLTQYDRLGYLCVKMCNKQQAIHVLVAKYCIGERPEGYVVNHLDGNKKNNRPENLEYTTIALNIKQAIEQGFHVANDSTRHGNYKDGRSVKHRRPEYKREWYFKNRDRILAKVKSDYELKKCI